jgi:hypothetical protein
LTALGLAAGMAPLEAHDGGVAVKRRALVVPAPGERVETADSLLVIRLERRRMVAAASVANAVR